MPIFIRLALGLLLICRITITLAAGELELAKAVQNPLSRNQEAKYYSLPFINDVNFGYGVHDNTQDILNLKPIIPFTFTNVYDLIVRPIWPLYHQPGAGAGGGYINGWGDINPTAFISPAFVDERLMWGVGPSLFVPIATNKAFGSGKWSLGPQLAIFSMPSKWVVGFLVSNVWSFAGDPSRKAVDQFSLQYFISYNLPKGWYLTSQPIITANWKAKGDQQWTVPVGIGLGRAFRIETQAMNLSATGYYNIARPAMIGPNWTLQAKVEFLFPHV